MTPGSLRALVVEDKRIELDVVKAILVKTFGDAVIDEVQTECAFRQWLAAEDSATPDLVLLDIMLPWTMPARHMEPPPDDVRSGGSADAGLRCYALLRGHERYRDVPVIFLSSKPLGSCPAGAEYVVKLHRDRLGELLRTVVTRASGSSRG